MGAFLHAVAEKTALPGDSLISYVDSHQSRRARRAELSFRSGGYDLKIKSFTRKRFFLQQVGFDQQVWLFRSGSSCVVGRVRLQRGIELRSEVLDFVSCLANRLAADYVESVLFIFFSKARSVAFPLCPCQLWCIAALFLARQCDLRWSVVLSSLPRGVLWVARVATLLSLRNSLCSPMLRPESVIFC